MRFIFLVPASILVACSPEATEQQIYDTATVETGTIEVSVSSAGVVEALATVEVKSKASGEVLELFVETGDHVEQGTLMVHIDPRTARNRLAQSEAELKAAQSRRQIAASQLARVKSLVEKGTLTQTELETAELDLANAEAQVVTARVSVENARIAVDDTDIRAPITGTIIQKPVEVGQVISSPTQNFSGGTVLMTMADLSAVQIRMLVDETDIGKLQPGLPATVAVAAYPARPFPGEVVKIEPQAVIEQNVTMFAVLVAIRNPDGLLMPGMNAEVDVRIARSENVMTVPVVALRTSRDIPSTAAILDMPERDLRDALAKPVEGDTATDTATADGPETITLRNREIVLPEGVSADEVRAIVQKRRSGGTLTAEEQQLMRRVFEGAGSRDGGGRDRPDIRFGGDFWVVVDTAGSHEIRRVRTGVTDLDRVEIVSGLAAGETVLVLPSAHLVETQQDLQSFINRRMRGVPGIGN